ncbi:PAS domain-containing sensor histidine kinase [Rhodobacteraceae bacterium CCMM004]|nr:PAS domain-containing sensor histidine kinase [Rhodobacteraceae bacterium CCMM004]
MMLDLAAPVEFDRLSRAMDQIPLPVFVVRRIGPSRYALARLNRCYETTVGLRNAAVANRPMDTILPARMAATLAANYDTCLARQAPFSYEEMLRIGGREAWWRTTLTPLPTPEDGAAHVLGVASDITADKAQQLSDTAEIARMKGLFDDIRAFAGLTAHDMRGPLGNLVGLIDLILDDFTDHGNGKRRLIEKCAEVAETGLEAIDRVMARVTALNRVGVVRSVIDLGHMCRDLATLADPAGRLEIAMPEARVESDHAIVQTALRNLMDNASRFCRTRIAVEVAQADTPDRIALTVSDDGPGFASGDDIAMLTAPRLEDAAGRGFGLQTVAALLTARDGTIEVAPEGRLGGATVTITLPGRILAPTPDGAEPRPQLVAR